MLTDFDLGSFTHDGITHPVYRAGNGPGVLVIHEIPGITPPVLEFAERLVAAGYSVFMPELFGTVEKPMTNSYAAEQITRACISREFNLWSIGKSSPVTNWLRALSKKINDDLVAEGFTDGIGAIGMCLTGNFALTLMVDPWVMAPVLSQPSLPLPIGRSRKRDLHITTADLDVVKARAITEGRCVLGLRFTGDTLCPPERFERLEAELGENFEGIEIDSGPDNDFHISRRAHSVVTTDLIDEDGHPTRVALDRVLSFFEQNLYPAGR